ncbi:MAG TPA: Na+/H+ antiporter [Actinotalea sp.]|jgi:CPA1 family monovalent cation:H+ antiporter
MGDQRILALVVILGLTVVALTALAHRIRVAPAVPLLLGGVLLALVPGWGGVAMDPGVVLLLFLPGLLYWESLNTSLREIRANLRVVILTSVLLVLVTAAVVAVAAHAIGMPWPTAWVLGAVLSPTDATAVSAIARSMPRRMLTTLRAESLINDGTALVLLAIALEVAGGSGEFRLGSAAGLFFLAYGAGIAAGGVTALAATFVRRKVEDPVLSASLSILTPFAAFLLAEVVHGSGVLAVVVSGLVLSQVGPRFISAGARVTGLSFWRLSAFLLNGTLFVLVGLQVPRAVRGLDSTSLTRAGFAVLVVGTAVIGTRLAWSYTTPYVIRALDRRPSQRLRRVSARHRLPSAWAGFRGAVSLAAALSIPTTLKDGAELPGRDLVVLVTAGVILLTILIQGLSLPAVLRWARLPADRREAQEERLAQRAAAEAGLAALPMVATDLDLPAHVVARVRDEYVEHLAELSEDAPEDDGPEDGSPTHDASALRSLRAALLPHKRAAVVQLRDDGTIDDIVLRRVQARLDVEDLRLAPPSGAE